MKLINFFLVVTIATPFISASPPAINTYTLSKNYTVTIDGTSNLHSWNEKAETVSGYSIINLSDDGSFDLNAIEIKIDVHSIKSDMGSIMNNNTYKALKAEANPEIIFKLTAPIKSIEAKSNKKIISAKGNLTIAGITKPVDMQVKVSMRQNGELSFEGSQTVKMTDYGVDPPTALFGTLKTGNEITIHFKTNFIKSTTNI